MEKNFASSSVMRQNVLNNQLAVGEIQKAVGIKGILFENEYKFVKKQIADFFEVTERTIELCPGNWNATATRCFEVNA